MNVCDIIWTITFWDNKSFVYRHYHGCIYRAKLLMQYYDDKMYGISGCWQNMLFKRVKAIISLSSFKAWIGLPSMVRFLSSIFAFAWKYFLKNIVSVTRYIDIQWCTLYNLRSSRILYQTNLVLFTRIYCTNQWKKSWTFLVNYQA